MLLADISNWTTEIAYDNIGKVLKLVQTPSPLGIPAHNPKVHFLAPIDGAYNLVGGAIALAPPTETFDSLPRDLSWDYTWERLSLEESDDLHCIEASVKIQALYSNSCFFYASEDTPEDIKDCVLSLDICKGYGDSLVLLDEVCSGIAVETGCSSVGLAPADFPRVLRGLAVVWEQDEVNSYSVVEASDARREVSTKEVVEVILKGLKAGCGEESPLDMASDGVSAGAMLKLPCGILNSGGLCRGVYQYSPDVLLGVLVAFYFEVKVFGEGLDGKVKDFWAGQLYFLLAFEHLSPPGLGMMIV